MAPQNSKILVCATSKPAEKLKTLPITARAGARRKIVLRLGPDEAGLTPLPDLRPGDRLKVLVELAVTTDCRSVQQGDCVKQPYAFAPRVRARLLLADRRGAKAKDPGHAILLTEESATVTQDQHHDVFVLEHELAIPGEWRARQNYYVIVALDAHNRYAKPNQVLLIGANKQGSVQQDMARISIARIRPGDDAVPQATVARGLGTTRLPLTKEKKVLFSVPLQGLAKDEQLTVGAMVEATGSGLPYKARISTRLVLADSPGDTDLGREARKVETAFKGEISEHNGTNCLPGAAQKVRVEKVGVLRVARNARGTHHVNLVAESADPVLDRTDTSLRLTRGSLAVTRFAASWKG
jgi:hypothetical protein